jgi:hypothetical protein
MASLRAHSRFLLENSSLNLMEVVGGGEANMTYFKAGINSEEFYHLHNELRKDTTQCSEYCRTLPSTFNYTGLSKNMDGI